MVSHIGDTGCLPFTPPKPGNFGWNVSGKAIFFLPERKFPCENAISWTESKIPKRNFRTESVLRFASLHQFQAFLQFTRLLSSVPRLSSKFGKWNTPNLRQIPFGILVCGFCLPFAQTVTQTVTPCNGKQPL